LEVTKAAEATADTDASLATLKASLASYEKEKASKMAEVVEGLGIPKRGKAVVKAKPKGLNLLKARPQLGHGTTRSMPTSPALGASFKTVTSAPTSAPTTASNPKLDALRIPLIHLLAVRPVSEKFLAQQTRSPKENCLAILQKFGREYRLDPSKWELSDKAYKELDVWNFKYPSQEDRQAAIENAISAFDRMRLSSDDRIWQKLLPKEKRGKGKTLSRHDFRNGPLAGRNTPRINVQSVDDAGDTTGAETDTVRGRLTPNAGEPVARSRSQDAFKKKRVSEKEAFSKRLLSKNPMKEQRNALEKERKEKEKKVKKSTAVKVESKFKSAEYVAESDEDDVVMKDPPAGDSIEVKLKKVDNPTKKKPAPIQSKKEERKPEERPRPAAPPNTSNHKKEPSSSSSISSPPSNSDSGTSSVQAERPIIQPPRPRNTSSPTKPSPLGSSPPTNASDFTNRSKYLAGSSSSSPHPKKSSSSTNPATTKRDPPKLNGTHPPTFTSTKRKADHLDDHTTLTNGKRHQSTSPSTGDAVSDSSGSNSPVSRHQEMVQKAQYFKKAWARYNKLHAEVSSEKNVSSEKKKKLWTMHERLEQMKKEIWDESERGGRR
jgi:RNA polymerase II elongation factor ELL